MKQRRKYTRRLPKPHLTPRISTREEMRLKAEASAKAVAERELASRVDHPFHYNTHPSGVECIDIAEWFSFNIGNAIKYLWRAGAKPDESMRESLMKAKWYVERALEQLGKQGG